MEVKSSTPIPGNLGHTIEIGCATWDNSQISVRNRYPTKKGGFSPRSSSEIPLIDVKEIIRVVADRDVLLLADMEEMISILSDSIRRRLSKSKINNSISKPTR